MILIMEKEERIKIWEKASVDEKYKLWQALDYEYVLSVTNDMTKEGFTEKVFDDMIDMLLKIKEGRKDFTIPVLAFNQIMKCPEI